MRKDASYDEEQVLGKGPLGILGRRPWECAQKATRQLGDGFTWLPASPSPNSDAKHLADLDSSNVRNSNWDTRKTEKHRKTINRNLTEALRNVRWFESWIEMCMELRCNYTVCPTPEFQSLGSDDDLDVKIDILSLVFGEKWRCFEMHKLKNTGRRILKSKFSRKSQVSSVSAFPRSVAGFELSSGSPQSWQCARSSASTLRRVVSYRQCHML